MRGIVIDMQNPSKAFLEGYPNSNCEQFQELLDQVQSSKRKEFVEKTQKYYQQLLRQRKTEFSVCVHQLNDEIAKFVAKDGSTYVWDEKKLKFNGYSTTKHEPHFYDRMLYEKQLENMKERKYNAVEELELLNAKAKKHLFSSHYKKEEREKLKKRIFNYDQNIAKISKEYNICANNFETASINFVQARPVLETVEKLTFLVNSIHKTNRLLDYMSTDKRVSAKQFVEEYQDTPLSIDQTLQYAEQIEVIINNNKTYKKEMSVSFMRDHRDEAVNIEIELPQQNKVQQSEMEK